MTADVVHAPIAVILSIVRDPALVRTVRLVAAAVARRTGLDEDSVEEVRLAVGEACALMLGEDDQPTEGSPVTVAISHKGFLRVDVTGEKSDGESRTVDPWAVIRGLIEDFEVATSGKTTTLSMCWPAA